VWQPIGGNYHCKVLGTDTHGTNTFHTVSVSDANLDTVWKAGEGGATLDTMNVNFSRGTVLTNGERHSLSNPSDSARAIFKSLQKQVAGNGSTWFNFSASAPYCDTDPGYIWQKVGSEIHTEVVTGSGGTC
jgi:hypothetical protein